MTGYERRANLPENPVGNTVYKALTDADALTGQEMSFLGGAIGRIEQELQNYSPTDTFELYTDEDQDTAFYMSKEGDEVNLGERENTEDVADIEIFGNAFEGDITALFEDTDHYHRFSASYRNYAPTRTRIQ